MRHCFLRSSKSLSHHMYLFVVCAVTFLLPPCSANPPIYIGVFSNLQFPDPTVVTSVLPIYDAIKAAVNAQNLLGGVHGRQVVTVECESDFDALKYQYCMGNFTANYSANSMLALYGVFVNDDFLSLRQSLIADNFFLCNPMVQTDPVYDRHWAYMRADANSAVAAMVNHIARDLHLLRVAFMWNPELAIGGAQLIETIELCAQLGLEFVGILNVSATLINHAWMGPANYTAFLATKPQVLLSFGGSTTSNFEVFLDLLNRSVYGNGVDPNLKIITWEGSAQVLPGAIGYLQSLGLPITPSGRLYFVLTNPTMADSRYVASQHCIADMTAYWGTNTFLNNGTFYLQAAMQSWIGVQVLIRILQKMDPTNMTRQSLMDSVFDSSTYTVDDLTFGMYTGACDGVRLQENLLCNCNQGYRTIETYLMDDAYNFVPVENGRITSSFAECGSASIAVPQPLVYLLTAPTDATSQMIALELLAGANATATSAYENCSATTAQLLPAAIQTAISNRYFSVMFPAILDPSATNVSGLAVIDPFYYPATLAPSVFVDNVLYVTQTLQQEIYALCQIAVSRNLAVLAVLRTASAAASSAFVSTITQSLNTFGASPAGITTVDPSVALSSVLPSDGAGSTGSCRLILGVTSASDVNAIAAFLVANPKSVVMVAFSELSVLYDTFVSQLTAAQVEGRLLFATSLRNWNAETLASQSPLMQAYFATFPSAPQRTPLTLRGFVVNASVQRVLEELVGVSYTSSNILSTWYSLSVIALSSADFVGAYSRSTCFSVLDTACETNVGARVVNVMALGDVTTNANNVVGYQSSSTFASSRIPYQALPTSTSLSRGAVAGIGIGCLVAVGGVVGLICWAVLGGRNNRCAPKDPTMPVTLVFTDIENSTALWATVPDAMALALDHHHEIIRDLIAKYKCYEVKTIGDSFMIASKDAVRAVQLAVELQRVFFHDSFWSQEIDDAYLALAQQEEEEAAMLQHRDVSSLKNATVDYSSAWHGPRIRIGIHTGIADIKLDEITKGYDYYGNVSNVAARTESTAQGGQVLLTRATHEALQVASASGKEETKRIAYLGMNSVGNVALRGITEPLELFQVDVISGRTFVDITKRLHDAADEDDDDNWTGMQQSSETSTTVPCNANGLPEEGGSIGSGRLVQHRLKRDWVTFASSVISTLLSTTPRDAKRKALQSMCDRWHISVPQPQAVHINNNNIAVPTMEDLFTQALAKRIAPMMKKKFGPLTAANTLITKPAPETIGKQLL